MSNRRPRLRQAPAPFVRNDESPQAFGLRGWWPGLGGTTLFDKSVGKKHLVLTNFAAPFTDSSGYVAGKGDGREGIRFDGTNDYAVGGAAVVTYPLTMMAWVKLIATPAFNTDTVLMCLGKISGLEEFWVGYQNAGGNNLLRSVAQANSASDQRFFNCNLLPDLNWHHIAVVFTNSITQTVYYDGLPQAGSYATAGSGSPSPLAVDTMFLGSLFYNTSNQYGASNSVIDDARLYNYAVPAPLIWAAYVPQTRWDLRWQPSRRTYPIGTAVAMLPKPVLINQAVKAASTY